MEPIALDQAEPLKLAIQSRDAFLVASELFRDRALLLPHVPVTLQLDQIVRAEACQPDALRGLTRAILASVAIGAPTRSRIQDSRDRGQARSLAPASHPVVSAPLLVRTAVALVACAPPDQPVERRKSTNSAPRDSTHENVRALAESVAFLGDSSRIFTSRLPRDPSAAEGYVSRVASRLVRLQRAGRVPMGGDGPMLLDPGDGRQAARGSADKSAVSL